MSADIDNDYIKNNNMKYTCDRKVYAIIYLGIYL